MKIDQAEDAVCAKDRELRAVSIELQDAKSSAHEARWHLDRLKKKLADALEATEEAKDERRKETAGLRSQFSTLQKSEEINAKQEELQGKIDELVETIFRLSKEVKEQMKSR